MSDRVAIGVLTRTYPPALIDQVLAQTGRGERRHRLLPARLVVYYVLALALFAGIAYEEVLRCLVEALRGAPWWPNPREPWRSWHIPAKSALVQARARLGAEPLRMLFEQAAQPLATEQTQGGWYRGRRLVALDGTCLDVADTPANQAAFGRPGTGRGQGVGAFPQVRLVALVECGTHAITKVAIGPCTVGETSLAPAVLEGLGPGTLALADRGLLAVELWRQAQASGAELLWRAKTGSTGHALPVDQALADGSWLSRLDAGGHRRRDPRGPVTVRVLDYTIDTPRPGQQQVYRLVTSILDPAQAPAAELAALYHQRWELEGALDELKTHQRGPRAVLRSKTPDGVEQEVYAHLLVHYAIRALMHQAALDADLDPDRLSFTRSLRIVRRQLISQAAFSP
ncbi:MAG TPA: IS4 family transposase [Actinomycetes bacterium]|nr:IS4 family transposase [Actinomycetes bacterium]